MFTIVSPHIYGLVGLVLLISGFAFMWPSKKRQNQWLFFGMLCLIWPVWGLWIPLGFAIFIGYLAKALVMVLTYLFVLAIILYLISRVFPEDTKLRQWIDERVLFSAKVNDEGE